MPHAVEEDDDALINQALASAVTTGGSGNATGLGDWATRDLEIGEKADDAEDYEDIGDDDLGDFDDDEVPSSKPEQSNGHIAAVDEDLFGDGDGDDHDDPFHDLFGQIKDEPTSPPSGMSDELVHDTTHANAQPSFGSTTQEDTSFERSQQETGAVADPQDDVEEEDAETLEQRKLFEQATIEREARRRQGAEQGSILPPAPETDDDVFYSVWPQFEPDKPPKFGELLPGRRAHYLARRPLKPPRSVQPTKVSLDLAQDQEKAFRLPAPPAVSLAARLAEAEAKGIVLTAIEEAGSKSDEDEDEFMQDSDDERSIAGLRWDDIVAVCQDWTIAECDSSSETQSLSGGNDVSMDDDLFGEGSQPGNYHHKRKSSAFQDISIPSIQTLGSLLDDPEKTTARLAKRVRLDLNDPCLLVDIQETSALLPTKRKTIGKFQRDVAGGLTRDFTRRYNISNDEAYDLLKENHQSKVRSNLANVSLEHALPAAKLQFPFYKVKLEPQEARAFHRPALDSKIVGIVHFEKTRFTKRKHLKGRETQDIFATSQDLSVADNSNVLLLEYSEEYPNTLSNFGMANKVLNYYRRKDEADTSRPKYELGETSVLLPQDKSPFSIFGDVKPGETVPTLHNGMYRAPIFRHDTKPTDFLLVCNRTGIDGRKWYLRNVENLHVVGQEFPSVEVPGTHSRKVTDAAKKRLRMMSYRMFKRHKRLKNEMILKHLPGSDVPQNRSKMREFMDYDKDRGWLPRKGEVLPDETVIRSWIKPEDLCLLESMQVGDRQLQDAGYSKDAGDDDLDDEDEKNSQSIDQQLAPWQTSKNFLAACQGKAFVAVHGEGDPTGRGEGYNLVRTSMKGGYREVGESIEDKLDAKRLKELGGHQYNVARQHKAYTEALLRVWDAQKKSLSSSLEHDDADMGGVEDAEENRLRSPSVANGRSFRGDDATTNITSHTNASQAEKVLRIRAWGKDQWGVPWTSDEVIRDPTIIREYKRRRNEKIVSNLSIDELKPTGNADLDDLIKKKLRDERDRIKRNQERRHARNKAKGLPIDAGSPGSNAASPDVDLDDDEGDTGPSTTKPKKNTTGGTQRKCANCGQVGHIKTNKKLCPMLNGTIKQPDGFGDSAFGSQPTPSLQAGASPAVGFS